MKMECYWTKSPRLIDPMLGRMCPKIRYVLLALVVSLYAAVGCGKQESTPKDDASAAKQARVHLMRGMRYLYQARNEEAIKELEQALSFHKTPVTLTYLGQAYSNLRMYDKSIPLYEEALKLDPFGQALAHYALDAMYRQTKQYDKLIAEHKRWLTRSGDFTSMHCLGSGYFLAGQYDQAIATLKEAIEVGRKNQDPDLVIAVKFLADAYAMKGMKAEAKETYEWAMQLDPGNMLEIEKEMAKMETGELLLSLQPCEMPPYTPLFQTTVAAELVDGQLRVPLDLVEKYRLVAFMYDPKKSANPEAVKCIQPIPLLAYLTPGGNITTMVRLVEECGSRLVHIVGDHLVCSRGFTEWDLEDLSMLQCSSGGNQPPKRLPHKIEGEYLIIEEQDILSWRPDDPKWEGQFFESAEGRQPKQRVGWE